MRRPRSEVDGDSPVVPSPRGHFHPRGRGNGATARLPAASIPAGWGEPRRLAPPASLSVLGLLAEPWDDLTPLLDRELSRLPDKYPAVIVLCDLLLYYSSPVVAGDLIFGMSTAKGGCFFCLDAKSGRTLWESDGKQGGYASVASAGCVVLFLTDRGRLIVAKASGAAYEPVAEYRVSDRQTEAHPVFLGGRILIKDDTTLRSFRIEPDAGKP